VDDKPIAPGILLHASLAAHNQMTIMSDWSEAQTIQWMDANKIVDFDKIIDRSVHLEGELLQERQIRLARATQPIDLFITNNPTLWAFAFDLGITSIMFGVPSYTRPEFRPDAPKQVRAWDDITSAIEKQNALRTQDVRLTKSEGFRFE
jgi:hypothetical protein